MKLTACLYQVPRLRMSGAKSPLPLFTFTACTGTTLPLSCLHQEVRRIITATEV
jgi:hypothetical protein